jgi:hypothetical protein
MGAQIETPWQGDWSERLQLGIRRSGYRTLDEFLAAHPGDSYYSLARLLDANIAPMQLYGEQLRNAHKTNRLRAAAADCLARFLSHYVKRGWNCGRHFRSRLASAYAAWRTSILQFSLDNEELAKRLDAVWTNLEENPPPVEWRPTGASDRYIVQAFAKGWPE